MVRWKINWRFWREKDSDKMCFEDPHSKETRKALLYFDRRFRLLLILSVIYGVIFVNYIDINTPDPANTYHLWLFILYFAPFVMMTWIFPRNWALTLGLGFTASLMNDVFYGLIKVITGAGLPLPLAQYYAWWLIPSGNLLFNANIGFAVVPVYSWMMAMSIYSRVAVVVLLFRHWKGQLKRRCLGIEDIKKSFLL